jgi:quercetin dioxygenase-like cupin family protein
MERAGEPMTVKVRRVVTGHDGGGRAIVKFDEVAKNIVSSRPGASACVVWTTDTIPADNSGGNDAGQKSVGTTLPGGTVFRVIEFSPGVAPRMHRTDSIDYAVVISGEIDMELEKGSEVHLKAGDVLVQRGTVHNWINRGTAPCVMAFVLVDAKSAVAGGRVLGPHG